MPALPNFLLIGAAKSGTTALYSYLGQHPEIFTCPVKEPKFFAHEGGAPDWRGPGDDRYGRTTVTDIATYLALFHGASGERAVGEASTQYLYLPRARERIKYYVPRAKLIAILRDPAEVAYAAFLHKRREGLEPFKEFARALESEGARIRENWSPIWHYKQRGYYYEHLAGYYRDFSPEQIRVYIYDDFKAEPLGVIRDIFRFLGVEDSFVPDMSSKPNRSGVPRSRAVHDFLTGPNPASAALKSLLPEGAYRRGAETVHRWNLARPPLPPGVRRRLVEEYREDVEKLQALLRRDLTTWLMTPEDAGR
jgi:hypothetical protein